MTDVTHESSYIGIPATILTWLSYMNIMALTPVFQFIVTILSFVWLCIQIGGWIQKTFYKKPHGKK